MTANPPYQDSVRLIDDTLAAYLEAAHGEEFTDEEAIQDLLTVVARRARDLFGKRATAALVERVMAEDPRPEGLPIDTEGVVRILGAGRRGQ